MNKTLTLASGRTLELPAHVEPADVVGQDAEGRIVVREDWMKDYSFGLTLCCNAWDKGAEWGACCRTCYGDDAGVYHPDGGKTTIDRVVRS